MKRRVSITTDTYRQGFGQEGILVAEDRGWYVISFQDDAEEYICLLHREDFEFID